MSVVNILHTDYRLFEDINNTILSYYQDNLYESYKNLVEDDNLGYFEIINSFLRVLSNYGIIPGDSEKIIKDVYSTILENTEKKFIDSRYDIYFCGESHSHHMVNNIHTTNTTIYVFAIEKRFFIKDIMMPVLIDTTNSLRLVIFRYPKIIIRNIYFEESFRYSITFEDLLKFYTKIWMMNRKKLESITYTFSPKIIIENFNNENITIYISIEHIQEFDWLSFTTR